MQKNIRIFIPLLISFAVLVSSCSKKKNDPAPVTPTSTYTPATKSGSYFPLTSGNMWSYTGDKTYSVNVTNKTMTINAQSYSVLTQKMLASTTPDTSYAYQDGNKYYVYANSSIGPISMKIIDLDLPIGATWTSTVSTNMYTDANYTYKITGTGLSRVVNNLIYNDVISVQLETTTAMSAAYTQQLIAYGVDASTIASLKSQYAGVKVTQITYYAKNVGLIDQTSTTFGLNVHLESSIIK
jgi:hypothetical protein